AGSAPVQAGKAGGWSREIPMSVGRPEYGDVRFVVAVRGRPRMKRERWGWSRRRRCRRRRRRRAACPQRKGQLLTGRKAAALALILRKLAARVFLNTDRCTRSCIVDHSVDYIKAALSLVQPELEVHP